MAILDKKVYEENKNLTDGEFLKIIESLDKAIKAYLISRRENKDIPEDQVQTPITISIDNIVGLLINLHERLREIEEGRVVLNLLRRVKKLEEENKLRQLK